MQAFFLLLWFWLMAGVLFANVVMFNKLFQTSSYWQKTIFWPYFLVKYFILYIKIKQEDEEEEHTV